MVFTYLILKITFQAILEECNRLAADAETRARAMQLKSRILELDMAYETGVIDEATYKRRESEIVQELGSLGGGENLAPERDELR